MRQDKQQKQNSSSSVKVFIRVRPLLASQKETKQIVQIGSDVLFFYYRRKNKTMKIYHDQINHIQSKFDQIIGKDKSQIQVFQNFQPFIQKIFQGFNLTIFAYGQTGSGKTYTMFGSDWENFVQKNIQAKKQNTHFDALQNDKNFAGIIPRSIYSVFKQFESFPTKYQIFCSFLQIYNEKIYDLLQDSATPKPLNIHQSKVNGIFVQGLTEFQVQHFADCLNLMKRGERNRFIRQTSMNAKSSRSHTIFQILIQATSSDSSGNYSKARLNLCDLAGSQKINKNQNMLNEHLLELKNINLSLTTLGKVIYSLSSGKKANIAAFRQSKLTRLLQQSLTANTNTFIIGNISPSSKNLDQTLNTLKFAERASHITMKIKPIQFSQLNPDSVSKLKKQIEYLKGLLNLKKQGLSSQEENNQQSRNQGLNQKQKDLSITSNEFLKLLKQNRQMKKQIYELQNNLEIIKGSTSSNMTYRSIDSAHSSNNRTQSQFSSNNQLRKEIYLQKFLKKIDTNDQASKNQNKRQNRNQSLLVSAGKATIDRQKFQNEKSNMTNKKQKINMLKKFQKIQSDKRYNDSLIMEELQNIHNNSPSNKKRIHKQLNSLSVNQGKKELELIPKRYHEANVFRRGKMSLQRSMFEGQHGRQNEQNNKGKKKKIDYSQKIKELQNRLYHK